MNMDLKTNICAINCKSLLQRLDDAKIRQEISDSLNLFLSSSLAENTLRAYKADLVDFRLWGGSIPSTPLCVAEYLASQAETRSVATIQRRVAAIAKAHKASGFNDPCREEIVKAASRGIRRTKGVTQREAKALVRNDLFAVLAGMGTRTIDIRDKALLLIGFAGAFRRSELVGLNYEDIEHVNQGIILSLRRSKTDQMGRGRKVAIPHGRTRWCPVQRLSRWITHAGITQGPLFRSINRHGLISPSRLSSDAVATILKSRAAAAGFETDGISGHSLRAGMVTSAVQAGASPFKIRMQTGHKSDAMLNRYVREGNLFIENAASTVL